MKDEHQSIRNPSSSGELWHHQRIEVVPLEKGQANLARCSGLQEQAMSASAGLEREAHADSTFALAITTYRLSL
jgi:hypothetical protein